MLIKNKAFVLFVALVCANFTLGECVYAKDILTKQDSKYPDYSYEFLGKDKFENINRKVFTFNSKLNKYALRPVHTVWASIMPKYGMARLQSVQTNIEYPRRLVSTIVQKDFKAARDETVRFLTNTTIGLGGMYDPAKRYLKLEPVREDMEQALAKIKLKQGPYLVLPIISSLTPRGALGRLLDSSLDPTVYIGSPLVALVKAGLFVNKTSTMQPLSAMVESSFADPYDIAKKYHGIENHIKNSNFDRKDVIEKFLKNSDESFIDAAFETTPDKAWGNKPLNLADDKNEHTFKASERIIADEPFLKNILPETSSLKIDIVLQDYNPQNPITDSMRTALFELPGIDDSIWSELSVWNNSFANKIKTASVSFEPGREEYKYRYILQKDKMAPVAIIYPSIGEGITSHNSVVLAKLFYEEGYSIIIQGSHFHWEFVKSMPSEYRPGVPSNDAKHLRALTAKILDSVQNKHDCHFGDRVLIGTSFGALTTLFIGDMEYKDNTLNITKYISINPPVEILFAMEVLDKNNDDWNSDSADLKRKTALVAAKVLYLSEIKKNKDINIAALPFSQSEAKLITGFILRQKLSDLILTIENTKEANRADIYAQINNTSYSDYANKYLFNDTKKTFEELSFDTSLHSIAPYLKLANNYKIYHTPDDYFTNVEQLKQLKSYSGSKTVLISNGSHLGFLYRQEFIDALRKDISLDKKLANIAK